MTEPRQARPVPLLGLALGLPAMLAVVQQQLLLHHPPRLLRLETATASSGPAALRARFSRPMLPASLTSASRLTPALAHRWLGEGDTLMLTLEAGQRLSRPLRLELAGRDRRGQSLRPQHWLWDPRPRVLAVVPVGSGEQVQVREHDGRWRAITPVWPQIAALEALGDGSGVAVVSRTLQGSYRVWRVPLQQGSLAPIAPGSQLDEPSRLGFSAPKPLGQKDLLFAHLSSNRRGELLVQASGTQPNEAFSQLWPAQGTPRGLSLQATGPMRLLPEGGAVVVPESEGLSLQDLPPRPPRRQTLPGSRDLSSFCPQAGRALLLRHWPDYRRSLELVEPGLAPRQLWIGPQALVATACARGGERVWALLVEGLGRPELTLLALDRQGTVLGRRRLSDWELEPGTGLHYDPSSDTLLAALRRLGPAGKPPPPAQAVLIDAASLELQPLGKAASQALWLPAG